MSKDDGEEDYMEEEFEDVQEGMESVESIALHGEEFVPESSTHSEENISAVEISHAVVSDTIPSKSDANQHFQENNLVVHAGSHFDIEQAIAQERSKWEKVLEASEQAGKAASQQVQDLTRQVAELRRRAEEADERAATRDAEMTRVRLECLEREKAAARRAREESEQALHAERKATEEAIQALGADEEERLKRKVAAAKKEWDKRREELEAEVAKLSEAQASQGEDKATQIKRERARAKKLEKQIETMTAEVEQLKGQLIQKGQQVYLSSIQQLSAEPPEVAKLHKQIEFYKNEARTLRLQMDAQRPEKVMELQGVLKQQQEEHEKLKDEIKTLKTVMGRQERAINQSKDLDNDYAAKLQSLLGDLQVSKDENRRLRERLDAAEKAAKSRSAIEEGIRRKAEALDKKCKTLEVKLKDVTRADENTPSPEQVDRDDAESFKKETDSLSRKCMSLESEKKLLKIKIKEKGDLLKTVQDALQRKDGELQARSMEARSLAMQVAALKRDMSSRDLKKGDDESKDSEVKEIRAQLADREEKLGAALNRISQLEKELSAARARIVPTSLADMAEMTPRIGAGRADIAPRVISSSRQKRRPRSRAGEAKVNDGLEMLDDVPHHDLNNDSLVSDKVNMSVESIEGSTVDDSLTMCHDDEADRFDVGEV